MIATEREVQILQAAVGPLDTPELRARYAAEGQKVRESLVVDLDNQVGPDARHSNPYQYDAEAQVIAEVVAQL